MLYFRFYSVYSGTTVINPGLRVSPMYYWQNSPLKKLTHTHTSMFYRRAFKGPKKSTVSKATLTSTGAPVAVQAIQNALFQAAHLHNRLKTYLYFVQSSLNKIQNTNLFLDRFNVVHENYIYIFVIITVKSPFLYLYFSS